MEKLIKSECGGACLQSQHSESRGKELVSLWPTWTTQCDAISQTEQGKISKTYHFSKDNEGGGK